MNDKFAIIANMKTGEKKVTPLADSVPEIAEISTTTSNTIKIPNNYNYYYFPYGVTMMSSNIACTKEALEALKELNMTSSKGTLSPLKEETKEKDDPIKIMEINKTVVFKKGAIVMNLFPTITDIKAINSKVVIVEFSDGTKEKAICDEEDVFSLEQGITMCLIKRFLSYQLQYQLLCKGKNKGSLAYNKIIEYGMKTYFDLIEKENENEKEKIKLKNKIEKNKKKKARRAEREKEAAIEIQKEAYLRALKEKDNIK